MQMKTCAVVGAADFFETPESFVKADMLIAADGGAVSLRKIGFSPDLIIGDFDSSPEIPQGKNVIVLPKEKDDTDMMAAIKYGLERGCQTFYLYGATGGRFDHTIANIQTLSFLAENKAQGFLFDKSTVCTVIKNSSFTLPETRTGYVSVFSLSEQSKGVTLRGLKYPLTNATLTNAFPLGVSNEMAENTAFIRVENGTLLITCPRKALR